MAIPPYAIIFAGQSVLEAVWPVGLGLDFLGIYQNDVVIGLLLLFSGAEIRICLELILTITLLIVLIVLVTC